MELRFMDNKKDDSYYAKKALDNLFAIKKYLGDKSYSDFVLNDELVDAVMFRLIQLIENIKGISKEFKNSHPLVPWGQIVGFRNGIVHEYGKTDYTIVYEIITDGLDQLEDVLHKIQ